MIKPFMFAVSLTNAISITRNNLVVHGLFDEILRDVVYAMSRMRFMITVSTPFI